MTEEGTITLKKSTIWQISTGIFAILFVVTLVHDAFWEGSPTGAVVAPTPTAANPRVPSQPSGPSNIKVTIDKDDPILGDKNAKISIVEFSDFQCPFCKRAADGSLNEFRNSDYFKNGEVNLIYKDFPLSSIHPYAQKAAEAAQCANDQGKFWEYHDKLFENQQALDIASLKKYADDLGLDTENFDTCLDGSKNAKEVGDDLTAATTAGGQGTPYFVIVNNKNGKIQSVSGAVPFSNIEAAIKAVQ